MHQYSWRCAISASESNHSALLILTLTTHHCPWSLISPVTEPRPTPGPRHGHITHHTLFPALRNTFTCGQGGETVFVPDPRHQFVFWRLQTRMTQSAEAGDGRGWSLFPPSEELKQEGVNGWHELIKIIFVFFYSKRNFSWLATLDQLTQCSQSIGWDFQLGWLSSCFVSLIFKYE